MASKSDILKRIGASKKGKPTWQDKNRLKTWKDAGKGSRLQKEGYDRAVRNMQRSSQQGQEFNKVDTQIFSEYVKETPEQILSKSKTFMNLATWLPVGGLAAKGVQLGAKALGKLAALKGKAPGRVRKVASEVVGSTTKGRRSGKALRSKTGQLYGVKPGDIRLAKNIRTGLAATAIPAAAVGTALALTGDEKNEKKVPKPKKKPTGSEVFWERAKRARAARAAEQKAITRSRAGRKTGIGAGRKAARVATAPPKNLLKKDKSASSTERELKSWEGGVRHADLPEWLGGGRVKIDSSDEAMNTSYPGEEYKKGGRLKKIVKKSKAKPHKAKTKTRQVAKKPRGVGVARKGYGKAMHG